MPIKTFTYLIGYLGLIPQYHKIKIFVAEKIHPKHKSPKPQQNLMLTNRRKFYKIHKNKKTSNNYEGTGTNYQR